MLVAIEPGRRNTAAIELAGTLATALDRQVKAAVVVVVAAGMPSPLRVGMTDEKLGELLARDGLEEAKHRLGDRYDGVIVKRDRSARAGLLAAIEEERPGQLVLGPAEGGIPPGHIHLGPTTRGLLNSSSVPVLLAPEGYSRIDADHPLRRVTVAFGPDPESIFALRYSALLAERADTQLRTATFWVRQASTAPNPGGVKYENELAAQWKEQMQAKIDKAVRGLDDLDLPTRFIHTDIADGQDWGAAIDQVDWDAGDLMVVGSSPPSGLRSVFLGSRSAEILRRATVPVAVLPAIEGKLGPGRSAGIPRTT
ncbi:MAG: universal stress protein [Solirubrobacteraceae bacterium]|nr:universal stress protein [Solirubrobacteraceae bacterium]